MPNGTARQRILVLIGRRNSVTATQIGQALNMSAATVRHHLSILAADGRIVVEGTAGGKRGRPQKTYRLSDRVAGENLAALADIALTSWLEGATEASRTAALRTMAQKQWQRFGPIGNELPAQKRIVQLIEKLNAMHYQARWEAGAEGPRILFGHCPYAAIIAEHPELCAMDTMMLAEAMDASAQQLSKIERRTGGASQCAFAMRLPKPRPGD